VPKLAALGGLFAASWALERTMVLPSRSWTVLATFAGNTTIFIDLDATNHPAAFYRLRQLP
jgi:hypothetical protein